MKKIKITGFLGVFLIGTLSASNVFALSQTAVGRYLKVSDKATQAQINPLQQKFQKQFPNRVQTVGQAIYSIMQFSGYRMVSSYRQTSYVKNLMKLPLPLPMREVGPISREDALKAIVGNTYQLIVDPAHRLISFRLRNKYRDLY